MQKAVEETIRSLQAPTHCYICDAKLQHQNIANQHYASNRHKERVKEYQKSIAPKSAELLKKVETSANATLKETLHCNICNVKYDAKTPKLHFQGDEHKKKDEAYCYVCNSLTSSKEQLWRHVHGSKHKSKLIQLGLPEVDVQYGAFDQTLPSKLRNIMLAHICNVCKAKFPTIKHGLDHYKSQKHKASVQHWFKEKRQQDKETSAGKVVDYYCFACKMKVYVEEVDLHRFNFPHTELAKLKSDMVSKGIIEEYWIRQRKGIICSLCRVQMCKPSDADEHFTNARHCFNFHNWCKELKSTEVLLETDTKWFYCKICDKALDCTSASEKHYLANSHEKKSQLYCYICDVRNSSQEMLEIHNTTTLHNENRKKHDNDAWEKVKKRVTEIPMRQWCRKDWVNQSHQETENAQAEKTDKKLRTNSENKNFKLDTSLREFKIVTDTHNISLKEQVFKEIEKLVETLYYSKTVPYNIALEYLKNVNREVEDFKRMYEKKERPERSEMDPEYMERSCGYIENTKTDLDEKNVHEMSCERGSLGSKDVSVEEEFYSFNSDSILLKETPAFNLIDFSDYLPPTTVGIMPEQSQASVNLLDFSYDLNASDESNLETCDIKTLCATDLEQDDENNRALNKNIDHINQKETVLPLEKQGDLETMLEEIIRLKNQVEEKYPDEENVEKDVLTEIEKLITTVKRDDIPLDVTLTCLKIFNTDLDLQGFTAQAEEEDGRKTEQGKVKLKHRYSKEDLISLRTDKTYTERLSFQLRMMISDANIWNRLCNDMDSD